MKTMKIKYIGERVIPNQMQSDPVNLILHLHRYIFALPYIVNKKCLDVACGAGYGTAIISMLAKKTAGVDIDEETIKWAKQNNFFYTKAKFFKIDLNKEQIPERYDIIISFETLEHLDSPTEFLKKIKSTLRLNGQLILSVPIGEPANQFHKHFFNWQSITRLVESVFGRNIKWYSQKVNLIKEGKDENALFAICLACKNSSFSHQKNQEVKSLLKKSKAKILEFLGIIPQSRW